MGFTHIISKGTPLQTFLIVAICYLTAQEAEIWPVGTLGIYLNFMSKGLQKINKTVLFQYSEISSLGLTQFVLINAVVHRKNSFRSNRGRLIQYAQSRTCADHPWTLTGRFYHYTLNFKLDDKTAFRTPFICNQGCLIR